MDIADVIKLLLDASLSSMQRRTSERDEKISALKDDID